MKNIELFERVKDYMIVASHVDGRTTELNLIKDLTNEIETMERVNKNTSLPNVSERPKFVKCSVTGVISVNQSGSSIGGGFWEYLYADEVAMLGIDPKTTKNADMVEGGR